MSVSVKLTPQETELVRLHSSMTRDTLAVGRLLIEMRSTHPRGNWTVYLETLAVKTGISRSTLFRYIAAVEKPPKEPKEALDFRKAKSPDGYDMSTLQSWLQKAIRRGEEQEALYAANQFYLTGFPGAVFNICITAASEDIGLAERGLVAELMGLQNAFKLEVGRKSEHQPQRLQLVHAVLLCVRAQKSRLIDHALIVVFEGDKRNPPPWVFDIHTSQGKRAGKTVANFFDEENASMMPKSSVLDPYQEEAKKIRSEASLKI